MSGGGGTTVQTQSGTSEVKLPAWLENAAQKNIARAQMVADIGYVPNYGLDVAAFSPMQQSAMQNTADAASAFGLGAPKDVMAGMPKTTTNNLGFTGYSSGDMFDTALAELAANRPAQFLGIQQMFTDPVTGVASVPTAMETLLDPNSTDAQIQALYGTVPSSGITANSNGNDLGLPDRTPLEVYQDSLAWMAGDTGWVQDNLAKAGLTGQLITGLADLTSKMGINSYQNANGLKDGSMSKYGVSYSGDDGYSTTNKTLAERMGWNYIEPPTVFSNTGFSTYEGQVPSYSNPSKGGNYDYSSGSGSLMGSLGSQVGTGSVNDASSNSGYAG